MRKLSRKRDADYRTGVGDNAGDCDGCTVGVAVAALAVGDGVNCDGVTCDAGDVASGVLEMELTGVAGGLLEGHRVNPKIATTKPATARNFIVRPCSKRRRAAISGFRSAT